MLQNGRPFVVAMDTGKACFAFSYTDPAGLVVPTSHANFRCEEGKLVHDKYPFSGTCAQSQASSAQPDMDYSVSNSCQFAPSHGGGVYERLVNYHDPAADNSSCSLKGTTPHERQSR